MNLKGTIKKKTVIKNNQKYTNIEFKNRLTTVNLRAHIFHITSFDPELNFIGNKGYFTYGEVKPPNICVKTQKEDIIDFICGNKWPSYLEEFFSMVIQELMSR